VFPLELEEEPEVVPLLVEFPLEGAVAEVFGLAPVGAESMLSQAASRPASASTVRVVLAVLRIIAASSSRLVPRLRTT
jgi:hypothetical protein